MINHIEAQISSVSIHHIPRYGESSGPMLSESAFRLNNEDMQEAILKFFFSPFKEPDYFRFDHIEDDSNRMYSLVTRAFEEPELLHELSTEMAGLLYNNSAHPNIKDGDLIVAHIDDVLIDDEMLSAIALVKSETKHPFLKVNKNAGVLELRLDRGMPINMLDKACIVFNTTGSEGYKCCVIDKTKSGEEAVFWKSHFLDVTRQFNDYQKTKVYIQATKDFIDERLKPMYDVEKQDEAQLLDLSKSFFNSHESFEEESYLDSLFGEQNDIKDEFRTYKGDYESEKGAPLFDNFKVSQAAVKNQSRVFRSVIKLDKNFHVYVHGNRDMIEKGVDPSGRKFYKLYFDQES